MGQRQIFVRFAGCDIACRYCDTPLSARSRVNKERSFCQAQKAADSLASEEVSGRMSEEELTRLCSRLFLAGPGRQVISLTGGEPLLHAAFLEQWLPSLHESISVYLETNGLRHEAMARLRHHVDVVSMDFKLPSATGLKPFWQEHEKFLEAARGTNLFAKAVVTSDTRGDDITRSVEIIAAFDIGMPFIIQPATGPLAPGPDVLLALQREALSILSDVRVIPQIHHVLAVP